MVGSWKSCQSDKGIRRVNGENGLIDLTRRINSYVKTLFGVTPTRMYAHLRAKRGETNSRWIGRRCFLT